MQYIPDKWIVVRINPKDGKGELHYRILAGWEGGYLDGDEWRLNSGITRVEDSGQFYNFHGYSDSIYRCHKQAYGLSQLSSTILDKLIVDLGAEALEDQDWLTFDWKV